MLLAPVTVCGDEQLDEVPGVTTCRAWADWWARRCGDLLMARDAADVLLLRLFGRWDEALQTGSDTMSEPGVDGARAPAGILLDRGGRREMMAVRRRGAATAAVLRRSASW